ncbi:MAG: hypothetical protein R6V11_05930 [Ectothiorhodospiraceae bacterium]
MSLGDDLLVTARHLAKARPSKPRQANLRRAISTSYYAAFHALAHECGDGFVGTNKISRSTRAWAQAYRALEHGFAKQQCNRAANKGFPARIVQFADAFLTLQEERHRADYDPTVTYTRAETLVYVQTAQQAIGDLRHSAESDRAAFAVWVLMKAR